MRIRRFLAVAISLALLLCVMIGPAVATETVPAVPRNDGSASNYVPKVVSVVYDSSGSMKTDSRWVYANYSLQILAGLLNEDDQLYVTYMDADDKQPTQETISMTGNRQTQIDHIRTSLVYDSWTPLSSVDTGMNKLTHANAADNAEYWLVIFSDGGFNDFYDNGKFNGYGGCKTPEQALASHLKQLSDSNTMPNGSKVRITYLAIGGDSIVLDSDSSINLTAYKANGADSIVQRMSEMADTVSGRYRLESSEISGSGTTTISVTSALPLTNISVLLQNTQAELRSITNESSTTFPLDREVSVRYSDAPDTEYTTDTSLNGTIAVSNNGGKNLPAGTYTLTFSAAVDTKTMDVLFDPAISVETIIFADVDGDGTEEQLDDLSDVPYGGEYRIESVLVETGTDQVIDTDSIGYPVDSHISVTDGEGNVIYDGKAPYSGTATEELSLEVETEVTVGDFKPITDSESFQLSPAPRSTEGWSAEITLFEKGKEIDPASLEDGDTVDAKAKIIDPQGNTISMKELPDGTIVSFTYSDGQSSDQLELKDIPLHEGTGTFTVTLDIPGYEPFSDQATVSIAHVPVWSLELDPNYVPFTFETGRGVEHNDSISFRVTVDGRTATQAEIEASGLKIDGINDKNAAVAITDGEICVTPQNFSWVDCIIPTHWSGVGKGEITVTATIRDQSDSGSFLIELPWYFPLVILGIVLLLLLIKYVVVYFITKCRFKRLKITRKSYTYVAPQKAKGGIGAGAPAKMVPAGGGIINITPFTKDMPWKEKKVLYPPVPTGKGGKIANRAGRFLKQFAHGAPRSNSQGVFILTVERGNRLKVFVRPNGALGTKFGVRKITSTTNMLTLANGLDGTPGSNVSIQYGQSLCIKNGDSLTTYTIEKIQRGNGKNAGRRH